MTGMARLAVEAGHRVSGSDGPLYPPMSDQLDALGIDLQEGYDAFAGGERPDLVVIGNALSRGNPAVEHVLSAGLPYVSGPEWLEREVLPGRHVIAVSGTHGKTTVTGLITWMLESAGLDPGFLVGGVLGNFGVSARTGSGRYFVIEADEYDTAFFDKRSKFVHYHPRTLVINNLEFDHADIFPNLAAIQTQFHHVIRTMPAEARVLRPAPQPAIDDVLERGCWSAVSSFGDGDHCDWRFKWQDGAVRTLTITAPDGNSARAETPLMGLHNAWNVTAAAAAAADAGVAVERALGALADFDNVRRRLELRGEQNGVRVYDDFAHHPTAIAATIAALRGGIGQGRNDQGRNHQGRNDHARDGRGKNGNGAKGKGRIIALLEPRSNTMMMGIHEDTLAASLAGADVGIILAPPDLRWDIRGAIAGHPHLSCHADVDAMVRAVTAMARPGDHLLLMSNGAFGGAHEKLLAALAER